jgi:hypothetical protein
MLSSVVGFPEWGAAARRKKCGDYTSGPEPLSIRDTVVGNCVTGDK